MHYPNTEYYTAIEKLPSLINARYSLYSNSNSCIPPGIKIIDNLIITNIKDYPLPLHNINILTE